MEKTYFKCVSITPPGGHKRTKFKELQATLTSVKVSVQQLEKEWAKVASMGGFQGENRCGPKKKRKPTKEAITFPHRRTEV